MSSKKTAGLKERSPSEADRRELVIITGLSGSGKGTVLKVLEDLGYYSVDNLPIELIPKFAELTSVSPNIRRAALVVDIREGESLKRFPSIYKSLRRELRTTLVFLEAADDMLVRRYSETRRPHPLGKDATGSAEHRIREANTLLDSRPGGPQDRHIEVHRPSAA